MVTLTVRNLYDDLKSILRVQATGHGQSIEGEVGSILRLAMLATGLGQPLRFCGEPDKLYQYIQIL